MQVVVREQGILNDHQVSVSMWVFSRETATGEPEETDRSTLENSALKNADEEPLTSTKEGKGSIKPLNHFHTKTTEDRSITATVYECLQQQPECPSTEE